MSPTTPPAALPKPGPRRLPRRIQAIAALLVAVGVGGAAVHLAEGAHRTTTVLALAPSPIGSVKDGTATAVKGQVTDVFGKSFVLVDDTGKALVDTGRSGEGRDLVKAGETVTVQGRFDNGALHAAVLSHADGRQDGLDPGPGFGPPPPPPGPHWFRAAF